MNTQYTNHEPQSARFECPLCGRAFEASDAAGTLLLLARHLPQCAAEVHAQFAAELLEARNGDVRELRKLREENTVLKRQVEQWSNDLEGALARKNRVLRDRPE